MTLPECGESSFKNQRRHDAFLDLAIPTRF
jgi:hypothetical protein